MAELKELVAKVSVDEATSQFAGHFKTNSSVRNLLRKYGNAKLLTSVVSDATVGNAVLSTPGTMEVFMSAIIAGFDAYVAKKAEWNDAKDKRPLPERVEFFRDAVVGELTKDEFKETVASAMTVVSENCESVKSLTGTDIDSDVLQKAITASAIRTIMIAAYNAIGTTGTTSAKDVKTGKPVEAEVIIPESGSAGHTAEKNLEKPETGSTPKEETDSQDDAKDQNKQPNGDSDKKHEIEKSKAVEQFSKAMRKLLSSNANDKVEAERIREKITSTYKPIIDGLGADVGFAGTPTASMSTIEWTKVMLSSSLPAHHKDHLGVMTVDKALEYGMCIATESIGAGNLAEIDQDKVSIAIMLGTFCMYSMLASQISGYENLDWVILPMLSNELMQYAADHDENVPVEMYQAFINLSGTTNLEKYKAAVNKALEVPVETSRQFAASRALASFAKGLGAKDAQKHINRGMELYMTAVGA